MNMQNTNAVFVDEKKFKKVAKNLLNKLNTIENQKFKLNSVQELLAESLGFRNYSECKKLLSVQNIQNIEQISGDTHFISENGNEFKDKIRKMTIFQQKRMFKIQENNSGIMEGISFENQVYPYIDSYLIMANIHSNISENDNFKTYYLFKDKNEIYKISHLLNVLTQKDIMIIGYQMKHDMELYIENYQKDYLLLTDLNKNIESIINSIEDNLKNPTYFNNIKDIMNNYLKDLLNLEENYSDTLIYHSEWFQKDTDAPNGYFYSNKITYNEHFYNSWLEMAEYKELVTNLLIIGVNQMTLTDLLIFMAKTVDSAKIEKLLSIYKQLNKNIEIVSEISQIFMHEINN